MVSIRRSETTQAREGINPRARPWELTGMVDVEALAAWAYGVQLVERFERAGLHAIEAAAAGFEVRCRSTDGVGQMMEIGHLGARIDRGGVIVSDAVHPAAYAVAWELAAITNGDRVRVYARAGTRPTAWVEPDRKARASFWVKPWEQAAVEYQGPGRKGGYCPIIITWDQARQDWGRDEYTKWWQGLADLAWRLSTRALGFVVTGPAAPAVPWAKSDTPEPISIDAASGIGGGTPTPQRVLPDPSPTMGCGSV